MLARPPVSRGHDEAGYAPNGIIDYDVAQMADLAVHGIDVVAGKLNKTAQMRIAFNWIITTAFGLQDRAAAKTGGRGEWRGNSVAAKIAAARQRIPAIIGIQMMFHLL